MTAVTNAVQAYVSITYTRRVYPGKPATPTSVATKTTNITTTVIQETSPPAGRRPSVTTSAYSEAHPSPVTPLASRMWGTWCMAVGIARLYAAYNLHDKAWYQLALWINIVGLTHYLLEAFVFETSGPSGPWLAPVSVASIGIIWQVVQYSYYVR